MSEIKLRFSDDIDTYIRTQSEITGMSKNDVVRSIIFYFMAGKQMMPYPVESDLKLKMMTQVNHVGNNINQIAHKVNYYAKAGNINDDFAKALLDKLSVIESRVQDIMTENFD